MTIAGAASALLGPRVKEVTLAFPGLPPGLEGLKIAQISDLHVGSTIRRHYVQRVVRKTNALAADLVALTGDITDGSVEELKPHVAALGELEPRGRVFYVPGNHEYYYGLSSWVDEMSRLGATVLANRGLTVERGGARLFVGGVTDPAARFQQQGEGPDPAAAAAGGRDADFRILLAHQPQIAPQSAAAGFDLQLSGHTHAGQFFPWTLVIRLFHKHYGGVSRSGAMQVYVSPGTGSWGPPIRLGSTTEVTLLRLVSKL
jgi:predicted MPP superfamily phosphohydrolase